MYLVQFMPSHEEHCQESLRKYGKRFDELHKWMDEPWEVLGRTHRMHRHDPRTTPQEAKKLFGEYADHACLDHIRLDYPQSMHEKELILGMDTNFCAYWKGNEKVKYCRYCAVEGTPCFELWKIVRDFAAQRLVFANNRPGNALGHRYRIESPKGKICYLQMLQGKKSRFALPIEDFLYVTRTRKGGMNETPSKTRQNPFVDLLLEIIATDPSIPNGTEIINAVRTEIPRKDEIDMEATSDKLAPLGPSESRYRLEAPSQRKEQDSTSKQPETSEQPRLHAYAGTCPRCGAPLVWRRAQLGGELYKGCTTPPPTCTYHTRSYKRTPDYLKSEDETSRRKAENKVKVVEVREDAHLGSIDETLLGPDESHFYRPPPKEDSKEKIDAKIRRHSLKEKIRKFIFR